jgi:hypothetical protein
VIAKHVVECGFVVSFAFVKTLKDEHTRKTELPTCKRARSSRRNCDAPWWNNTATELFTGFGVDDRNRCGEDATGSEHRASTNTSTFGHDATASDQCVVTDDHWSGLRRFKDATDSDST